MFLYVGSLTVSAIYGWLRLDLRDVPLVLVDEVPVSRASSIDWALQIRGIAL